jgi:hypothetical protein
MKDNEKQLGSSVKDFNTFGRRTVLQGLGGALAATSLPLRPSRRYC